jgi:Uncharacterized protein conserved in bacteria (DUF2272)
MASPIIFKGLTLEQASATAKFHSDHGAKVSVSPDGSGLFTVRVTYPAVGTDPPAAQSNKIVLSGPMSWFGGPDDTGVAADEGLALMQASDIASFPNIFLPSQPPNTTGLARRLNPNAAYVACRWDYSVTPQNFLRSNTVVVANPRTGQSHSAQPVDWGPNASTGRVADLSPGLAASLDLNTNDTCTVTIPLPESAPSPQATDPLAAGPSEFAAQVESVATDQWHFFGDQTYDVRNHLAHGGHKEAEDGWYQRVGTYWLDGTDTNNVDGRNHGMPWSAAFISWVMKTAGAGGQFRYSTMHSVYIFKAIRDLLSRNADAGFWCWRLNELKPSIGDVICWSRQPGIDYDNQNGGDYKGHCDIVVEVLPDRVNVIGGNVGDSVTRRPIPLNESGFLKSVTVDSEVLFAIMQNRIA